MDNQVDVSNPLSSQVPMQQTPQVPLAASLAPQPLNPIPASPTAPPVAGVGAAPASTPAAPAMPTVGTGVNPLGAPAAPASARPGSFAQKLLQAIGGVLTTSNTALTNLGDASAAVGPGGALAGIERTMAANAARIQEQKRYDQAQQMKQKELQDTEAQQKRIQQREDDEAHARIAESNARTLASRHSDYIAGQEQMDKQIAQGQADAKSLEANPDVPAQVLQRGITGDEMHALLQEGKINAYEYTPLVTGSKVTGTDADGNPIRSFTYDLVKVPDTWEPTDDQIARIKTVPGYENFQKGTHMSGAQVLSALSQADTIKTTKAAMDKAKADAGLAAGKEAQDVETAAFTKSGDWLRFLNAYHGNPVQAAQHIVQDPAMAKKYPGLYQDVMKQFATQKDSTGLTEYETMRHQYEVEGEARIKDAQNGLNQIGGGAMTDEMKANIAALPKDKQEVVKKYDTPTQASLYSIAFGPGDLDFERTFPNRVSSKSGQLDSNHALGIIKQLNPNWNEQQYKATQKAYHEITFGRNGQDVETYNNLLDHMAAAQDVIEDSLRKNNPKFLNSALNLAETEGWGTEAAKIQTALEPVKSEFEQLMNSGHALHEDQQRLYDAMVNPASNPAQLEAAFKNFGATGVIRLLGLNDQYKKLAGKNVPGIVRKEALESAKHLNLDPKTMAYLNSLNSGDHLFNNPDWTPGTPEQQQQQSDNMIQQRQAAADQARAIATQAVQSGKAPAGTTGIALNPGDGNWYYHNAQNQALARVQ